MIRIQTDDFDVGAEIDALRGRNTGIGAIVTFTGYVRDFADGPALKAMTLEHYPGMTERELTRIDTEAFERFRLDASLIIHRVGRLTPGERIVLVVTASAHRQDAFYAAEFLMDYLKTKAPFWKNEETAEGSRWVAARDSDDQAAARWSTGPGTDY